MLLVGFPKVLPFLTGVEPDLRQAGIKALLSSSGIDLPVVGLSLGVLQVKSLSLRSGFFHSCPLLKLCVHFRDRPPVGRSFPEGGASSEKPLASLAGFFHSCPLLKLRLAWS